MHPMEKRNVRPLEIVDEMRVKRGVALQPQMGRKEMFIQVNKDRDISWK